MKKDITIVCIQRYIYISKGEKKVYNPGDIIHACLEYMYEDGENSIIDDNYFNDNGRYLLNTKEYFLTLEEYREQQLSKIL